MRVSRPLHLLLRNQANAAKDIVNVQQILKRFPIANASIQPPDAQTFSISRSQDAMFMYKLSKGLQLSPKESHPIITSHSFIDKAQAPFKWMGHRARMLGAKEFLPGKKDLVEGCQAVLSIILEACTKRDLSPLAKFMLRAEVLQEIEKKCRLTELTDRQLECLQIIEDDYIGECGFIDRWQAKNLEPDDPASILSNTRITILDPMGMPMPPHFLYNVELFAMVRKQILYEKIAGLPVQGMDFNEHRLNAPKKYGLPYPRMLYASIVFAHGSLFSEKNVFEGFETDSTIYDFHLHSM